MSGQLHPFNIRSETISTTHEVDIMLNRHAPVAIGVSGGKDSSVAAWATLDYLEKIGHKGPRILIYGNEVDTDY